MYENLTNTELLEEYKKVRIAFREADINSQEENILIDEMNKLFQEICSRDK